MYSRLRPRALSSINFGACRYYSRSAANISPYKIPSTARNFQSSVQRHGQSALAESPSYEQSPAYVNADDLVRSQQSVSPTPSTTMDPAGPIPAPISPQSDAQQIIIQEKAVPLYDRKSKFDKEQYWQKIDRWKDVTQEQFLSHRWNVSCTLP